MFGTNSISLEHQMTKKINAQSANLRSLLAAESRAEQRAERAQVEIAN